MYREILSFFFTSLNLKKFSTLNCSYVQNNFKNFPAKPLFYGISMS